MKTESTSPVPSADPSRSALQLVDLFKQIAAAEDSPKPLLKEFRSRYHDLSREERTAFFLAILNEMGVRKADLTPALQKLQNTEDTDVIAWGSGLQELRTKLQSPRCRAFQQFINLRGGIKFLLDLRSEVLQARRHGADELRVLDDDIARLFNTWFHQGFLFLRRITKDSPFSQIQFLKEHELVHPMASLEEMGRRLGEDRLCFALFHQVMKDEVVIFIEVALTKGITRSILPIIEERPAGSKVPPTPDTAIFYSINNAQHGLAGLGFGKLLIFQVVDLIRKTHPHIETFSTLSPIPGFRDRYLNRILSGEKTRFTMKKKQLEALFPQKTRELVLQSQATEDGKAPANFCAALADLLARPDWIEDKTLAAALEKPLMELAWFYITKEKSQHGRPLNPVANFHLGNGATVTRANFNYAANPSPRGLSESCGMMINYVYSTTWRRQLRRAVKSVLPWQN